MTGDLQFDIIAMIMMMILKILLAVVIKNYIKRVDDKYEDCFRYENEADGEDGYGGNGDDVFGRTFFSNTYLCKTN